MLHSPSVSETSAAQGVPTPEPRGDSSGSMQDRAEGADAQLNLLKAEAIALRESGDKIGALAKVRQIRALKAQQQADERQMALELAHMTGLVWARGLLANPEERRKVSDTEFRRQDVAAYPRREPSQLLRCAVLKAEPAAMLSHAESRASWYAEPCREPRHELLCWATIRAKRAALLGHD